MVATVVAMVVVAAATAVVVMAVVATVVATAAVTVVTVVIVVVVAVAVAAVVVAAVAGVVEGTSSIANRQFQTVVLLPAYDRKFGQPGRSARGKRALPGSPSSFPPSAFCIHLLALPHRMSEKTEGVCV